jgi:DNA repair protein RadC
VQENEAENVTVSKVRTLCSRILGSDELGDRIVEMVIAPDEKATAFNIQSRFREAILEGGMSPIPGLEPEMIERLQSALKLGRLLYQKSVAVGMVVEEPASAAGLFSSIAFEPAEKFAVAALDIHHRLLSLRVMYSGTATETCVHPRGIFRWLMQVGALRCIVAHNHPSGDTTPSNDDILLTESLLRAARVMDIPVLDHMIVAQHSHQSLRELRPDLWV